MALNDFIKELAKKEILVPHLNRWFGQEDFPDKIPFSIEPNKEKDDAFHPSSDSHCCAALIFARMNGEMPPQELTATNHKTFMLGHFYHAILQKILVEYLQFTTWDEIEKEYDETLETESGVSYRVRGHADCASCMIPGHDEPYLVDIKTVNSRSFAQKEFPHWLWEKYYAQVQLYMHWHDKKKAILFCCEKDTPHRFKEYIVDYDPDRIAEIYTRWEIVADALAVGDPPDCDCGDLKCISKEIYATESYGY